MLLTVYGLEAYNNGNLKSIELNVEDYRDIGELNDAIAEELSEIGEEEYIVADIEHERVDVTPFADDYGISEDVFKFIELEALIGAEAAIAAYHLDLYDMNPEDIAGCYYGEYEDYEEFAQAYYEETGALGAIPDHIINYIDWGKVGRDLSYDFVEYDGHFFFNA
jgi:antirestriction protein